ncbi:PepSY domain-containing protein [Neisseria sp. S1]|uniref:PepSY domain-containing protein n=1 Tax=Neisseria sp. S1 TaxID=3318354 RepID=UPI003A842628
MNRKALFTSILLGVFVTVLLAGIGTAMQSPATAKADTTTPTAPVQTAAIPNDASAALQIVQQTYPASRISGQPQAVRFDGRAAYEVSTEQGLVYVDAATKQILSVPAALNTAPPPQQYARKYERDHDDDDEGEHGERDDG